ncbi:MAG: nitrite reductase (NAD(P)H) small subunit [Gemmatimonadota bacterium]|nr:nitrite reductase (NAD(P)H) small subunit [Gemmatimonadota bacterium]
MTESHEATPDLAAPDDLLADVERLIGVLSAHPDPSVGETALALLASIDVVHRTALTRLLGAIQSMAGDAFVNRLTADPAIRLLLMSYDLLAVDRRTLTEEALDAVRGHLHAHGVDVELVEVLGGVVTVRLHGAPAADDPAYAAVLRDIDEALSAGLLGFQELEIRQGKAPRPVAADSIFFPAQALKRAKRPVYRRVCTLDDITPGTTRAVLVDDANVLIARVDGDVYAVRNACGDGPLPLDYSTLQGAELTCSWHGCRYDIRTGRRLDYANASAEEQLSILPVRVTDGFVEVVVGTAPAGG